MEIDRLADGLRVLFARMQPNCPWTEDDADIPYLLEEYGSLVDRLDECAKPRPEALNRLGARIRCIHKGLQPALVLENVPLDGLAAAGAIHSELREIRPDLRLVLFTEPCGLPQARPPGRIEYYDAILKSVSETGSVFEVDGQELRTFVRYNAHCVGKVGRLTQGVLHRGELLFSTYGAQEYLRAPELDRDGRIGWKFKDGSRTLLTRKSELPGGEFLVLRAR